MKKEIKHKCIPINCPECNTLSGECNWWHYVKAHNMPVCFGDIEEADKALEFHLGYFWKQIKELIKEPDKSILLGTEQRDIKLLANRKLK